MRFGLVIGRLVPVLLIALATWGLGLAKSADRAMTAPVVLVAAIEGPIGPATAHHVRTAIADAVERNATLLVLRLNTPGGLVSSTREIVSAILTSPVAIVGYVAPPGGHAASAGTYILYATNIAAMAPGTNLGAATPIQLGGLPSLPSPEGDRGPGGGKDDGEQSDGKSLSGSDALTAKSTNDAVAFIRSLADMRGRNADWAERAVREAASLPAAAALEHGVIDIMASDLDELLAKVDGRKVTVAGLERTISTAGGTVETIEPGAVTQLLGILSNPNVAFMLMLIGFYGIVIEFFNPGTIAPGVIGTISLTLALYSLNQLPLNYAGLALVLLGLGFMVAEAITPTFGILGLGGLVSFALGSAMLIDTDAPGYQISWWLIGMMSALSAVILILIIGATWRAYRRAPAPAGSAVMEGEGRVLDWFGGAGHVWVHGERWQAQGPAGLRRDQRVEITAVHGLVLTVRADDAESEPPDDE